MVISLNIVNGVNKVPERTYTTHQIAKICDVYPSSVNGWINRGKLKAYETPGGHHRVTREELLSFLKRLDIPVPGDLKEAAAKDAAAKEAAPKRILIADDDAVFAGLVVRAFEPHAKAFKVEVCRNGADAVLRIGEWQPHLVILDIVMPRMSGYEVCYAVKKKRFAHGGGVKIVVVSGKLTPTPEKLEEHGIDAFFSKPVDVSSLFAKAAELLEAELETAP